MKKILVALLCLNCLADVQAQIDLTGRKARPRADCERVGEERITEIYSKKSKVLIQIRADIDAEKDAGKLKILKEKEKKELDKIAERAREDAIEVCSENPE